MPNYYVKFESGREILVWATDKESAKAKAQAKHKRKTGNAACILKVS
jgi:hypothetical protein